MNLYEISENYLTVFNQLKELDADEQTITDTLESLNLTENFKDKAIAVSSFFQNLDAEISAIKEAESRMSARRKALENKSTRLKDLLLTNMEKTGITSIECPYFKMAVANNPPSVEIYSEIDLPKECVREIIKTEPDKKAIKEMILEKGGCPGARVIQTKRLKIS